MDFKDMTVTQWRDTEFVSAQKQSDAVKILRADRPHVFHTRYLAMALKRCGVEQVTYRAADRMVQTMRKAGIIRYEGGCWHWNDESLA